MARTFLSILTDDYRLENKVIQVIKPQNYTIGYAGSNEHDFIQFLKTKPDANHILFVKPTRNYQSAYNETDLRSFAKIDIVVIAPPLAEEQIGIVQLSNISGYITETEITPMVFSEIIKQLNKNG